MDWTAKWEVFEKVIHQEYFAKMVKKGMINTVEIAVLGLLIGLVIGTLIATVAVAPKYKILPRILDKIGKVYVAIFRGTPLVVQLLVFYYVLPTLLGIKNLESLTVGIIVFGMNSGAYVSEIMRSGINSIDKGQMEAGRSLGLSFGVTMMKIVVPQAIKNILPTIGNEFISLIKETSVLSFITVVDLYTAFKMIGLKNYEMIIPYLIMAVIYIGMVLVITLGIKVLEKCMGKSERR